MIDMSSWKQLTADVIDDLYLDPHNVRLDGIVDAPEADIMADLFHNEKALALVDGIVRLGYLTHEVPIAVKRHDKLVVVEGNRRLAALKAIQNPYLVPEFQARVSALTADMANRDALRRIEVKLAPNQSDADQLIAALHTGNTRVAWTPTRQAAFFQAQVEQGKTLNELRIQYPTVEVEKFMLRSRIMSRFRSVQYSEPRLTDLVASRTFPASVLARVYESKDFIKLTGLRLDDDGELAIDVSPEVFAEMAERIVGGIADGSIDTRSIGRVDAPRFLALMSELRDIVTAPTPSAATIDNGAEPTTETSEPSPPKSSEPRGPSPSGDGGGAQPGGGNQPSSVPAGARITKSKTRQFLDTSQLSVPAGFPPAISKTLQELSSINVDRFPNATFDLMRTFLEKSIKAYAEAVNEDIRKSNNQLGYVYLKQCLEWLEHRVSGTGPRYLVQVVKKIQSNKINDFLVSMDHLNAINHNHHVFVTPDEVRQSWDIMLSVFAAILKPLPRPRSE